MPAVDRGQHLTDVHERGARRRRDARHRPAQRGRVVVGQVLRRLRLGEHHGERVPDHVVHVAGQAGLARAQRGDLFGEGPLAVGLVTLSRSLGAVGLGPAGTLAQAQHPADSPGDQQACGDEDDEDRPGEGALDGVGHGAQGVGDALEPPGRGHHQVDGQGRRRHQQGGGGPQGRPTPVARGAVGDQGDDEDASACMGDRRASSELDGERRPDEGERRAWRTAEHRHSRRDHPEVHRREDHPRHTHDGQVRQEADDLP